MKTNTARIKANYNHLRFMRNRACRLYPEFSWSWGMDINGGYIMRISSG